MTAEVLDCSAPGSVLLLGEYAVLQPGGLGVAAAVEPRVRVRASPAANGLRVEGTDGIERFVWRAGAGGLLDAVVDACTHALGRAPDAKVVEVDSSALTRGGRKLGLGSSAAVAVAVTRALLGGAGGGVPLDTVFRTALRAHRAAQGGRGSGYDVAASTFGGTGLFHGGGEPRFEPLPGAPADLFLVLGDRSLATPPAVSRYLAWAREQPVDCRRHRRVSDAIVRHALRTGGWAEALRAGRRVTQWLGEHIGVPVEPDELRGRLEQVAAAGHAGKPAGAGGELAICVAAPGCAVPDRPWVRPLTVSAAGVRDAGAGDGPAGDRGIGA